MEYVWKGMFNISYLQLFLAIQLCWVSEFWFCHFSAAKASWIPLPHKAPHTQLLTMLNKASWFCHAVLGIVHHWWRGNRILKPGSLFGKMLKCPQGLIQFYISSSLASAFTTSVESKLLKHLVSSILTHTQDRSTFLYSLLISLKHFP